MSKECDKPKNPATTTCRNCEQSESSRAFLRSTNILNLLVGHFSRDCPQPKDWSKVKCSQCGEST